LWKHLELDRFFEQVVDDDPADVAWLRCWRSIGCAPGSELAVEERWYPATALDDLLGDRRGQDQRHAPVPPHKTKLEQHLKQRYGDLFRSEFDVLLYNSTSTYVEGAAEKNPMMVRGYSRDHRPDCDRGIVSEENLARIRKRGGQYLLGAPRRQMKPNCSRKTGPGCAGMWRCSGSQFPKETRPTSCVVPTGRKEKERASRNRFSTRMELSGACNDYRGGLARKSSGAALASK
jgi:hypothetical protein